MGGGTTDFPTRFRVSRGTLDPAVSVVFVCRAFTLSGWLSKTIPLSFLVTYAVHNPSMHARWFRLLPFRSPLLSGNQFSFFSSGYLDVSVHRVSLHTLWIGVWIPGFIQVVSPFGYLRINGYLLLPPAFAAYHVLHRLLVPRHPPALFLV